MPRLAFGRPLSETGHTKGGFLRIGILAGTDVRHGR